jgi:hypothetical protein
MTKEINKPPKCIINHSSEPENSLKKTLLSINSELSINGIKCLCGNKELNIRGIKEEDINGFIVP